MGALFICRIQVSGGLLRYQLKNLSIGISMTILTTPYILHLSQLCCFLTFHFSPKPSKLFSMSIQRSIKTAKTQITKKCKNQTNLVRISTTTQTASHVFFTVVSSSAGWNLLRYLTSQFMHSNCIFWGDYRESVCPQTNSRFCHLTQPFPSKCNRSQYILIKCSNSRVKKIQFDWAKI